MRLRNRYITQIVRFQGWCQISFGLSHSRLMKNTVSSNRLVVFEALYFGFSFIGQLAMGQTTWTVNSGTGSRDSVGNWNSWSVRTPGAESYDREQWDGRWCRLACQAPAWILIWGSPQGKMGRSWSMRG